MFSEAQLRQRLPISGLGENLSFHQEVGSTNDIAHQLAKEGAPHGTLVIAESQTHGRGRKGRLWITKAGSGLAMSVLLRPLSEMSSLWAQLHALSALAVVQALECYDLHPEIKWPNDILLNGKKVAGILVEVSWDGDRIDYFIFGIGMNLTKNSVPNASSLNFPAVSLEGVTGKPIDPHELVEQILKAISMQLSRHDQAGLFESWEEKLAFLGQEVIMVGPENELAGTFVGINQSGMVELQVHEDEQVEIEIGDYQMCLRE